MTDPRAVVPTKAHPSDVGYDLTAISEYKKLPNGVTLYDTGIAIAPLKGYHTEIIPRSSMSKTNFMLANQVGIIDENYRGNLYIALRKMKDGPDVKLPFKLCQLVFRKTIHIPLMEVISLDSTDRGDGKFGSTN